MFDSVRITTWLFIPFLLFLKVSSLKIKLFKNFQGCFTVQLSRFLSCFSVASLPEQLWYHITTFSVCQQLFSTFLFFYFAVFWTASTASYILSSVFYFVNRFFKLFLFFSQNTLQIFGVISQICFILFFSYICLYLISGYLKSF